MMEENIKKAADFGAGKHFSIAATWTTLLGFNTETAATKMTVCTRYMTTAGFTCVLSD